MFTFRLKDKDVWPYGLLACWSACFRVSCVCLFVCSLTTCVCFSFMCLFVCSCVRLSFRLCTCLSAFLSSLRLSVRPHVSARTWGADGHAVSWLLIGLFGARFLPLSASLRIFPFAWPLTFLLSHLDDAVAPSGQTPVTPKISITECLSIDQVEPPAATGDGSLKL